MNPWPNEHEEGGVPTDDNGNLKFKDEVMCMERF
jgi:hypothetical protein